MYRCGLRSDSSAMEQSLTWMKLFFKYKVGTTVYYMRTKLNMIDSIENAHIHTVTSFAISWNLRIGVCGVNTEIKLFTQEIVSEL